MPHSEDMRTYRLPDEHIADLIADGDAVLLTLRWHTRTPGPGDTLNLDTLGEWRVIEVLRPERQGFGAVLRAQVMPMRHDQPKLRPAASCRRIPPFPHP